MKVIGLIHQKGGIGKTTLSVLMATALASEPYNKRIILIDCDHQESAIRKRTADIIQVAKEIVDKQQSELQKEDESKYIEEIKNLRNILESDHRKYLKYPIIFKKPKEVLSEIELIRESNQYDYVFIDMPGHAQGAGLGTMITSVDYALIPLQSGDTDVVSTKEFIDDKIIPLKKLKKEKLNEDLHIYLLFNRMDNTKKYDEMINFIIEKYEGIESINIISPEYGIPNSVFFKENYNTHESILLVKATSSSNKKMIESFKRTITKLTEIIE